MLLPLLPADLLEEVHTRFGMFVEELVNPGAVERDRTATPMPREVMLEAGRLRPL